MTTQDQELENTAKLFRSRIDGLTPELRAEMRLAGYEDRPRFNQKQAENMMSSAREPATRGSTASESGRRPDNGSQDLDKVRTTDDLLSL